MEISQFNFPTSMWVIRIVLVHIYVTAKCKYKMRVYEGIEFRYMSYVYVCLIIGLST